MFAVPPSSLLSAIRHNPLTVSTALPASANPEFPVPLPAYPLGRKVAGRKVASNKVQNHTNLAKPCKMNTCKNRAATLVKSTLTKSLDLKWSRMNTYKKTGGAPDLGSDPFAIARDRAMINIP